MEEPTKVRAPEGLPEGMEVRTYPLLAKTFDADNLTVEATLATENPVRVFDWERMSIVNEVLLTDGLKKMPSQVPLLDSHNRQRVADQLGSTIPRKENGKIAGTRRFSKVNEAAVRAAGMIGEGHLTDGSIGYIVDKSTWIEAGEKKTIGGRDFKGPLKVGTSWRLIEDSVTPIGADPRAKMRSDQQDENWSKYEASASMRNRVLEEAAMLEKLRKKFEALGLREGASDEEVIEFAENLAPRQEEEESPAAPEDGDAEKRAIATERARVLAIRDIAALAGDTTLGDELIKRGATEEEARAALVESAKKNGRFGGKGLAAPPREESAPSVDSIDDETFIRSLSNLNLVSMGMTEERR